MRKSTHVEIRYWLRKHPDGLTSVEISDLTFFKRESVFRALSSMPDTYIDRWKPARQRKREEAVWCAVVPPENCPKPTRKIVKRKEMNGHTELRGLVQ